MPSETISLDQAKSIILNSQLLRNLSQSKSRNKVLDVIDNLGYIQIDTISVIERSHNHTIWTRLPNFDPSSLLTLQSKDRKVFEYWGHAMAYLPMKDYRFYLSRIENFHNPTSKWFKDKNEVCKDLFKPILKRIKEEGPLSSKDFANPETKGGTWWNWKPAKIALEMLFWRGDLMVSERKNFHKYYDLKERVLPNDININKPSDEETAKYIILKALNAFGIASKKEIQAFLQPESSRDSELRAVSKKKLNEVLNILLEESKIIQIRIKDLPDNDYYLLPDNLKKYKKLKSEIIHFLSPFDNLIIQRQRIKNLFDFDYTLECYVPEPKRKFGYFVLPVLWGNDFVARVDLKADRKTKVLNINNLHFEDSFEYNDDFIYSFANKIILLSKFNNCEDIKLIKSNNNTLSKKISKELTKLS